VKKQAGRLFAQTGEDACPPVVWGEFRMDGICSRHYWAHRIYIDAMPSFANPAGLWALLGIPAIILIHFLQRKAVTIPVSTLFLLEKTQREASTGRNFDRITNSIPLWMQLLGVLLLTWLLVEPRFPLARSTQRIAIVIDSSASMNVCKERLIGQLKEQIPPLKGLATDVEYTLFESAPGKPRLYAGNKIEDMLAAIDQWRPLAGLTDPSQVLRLARSLVSREGIVIYATDTPVESLPFEARVLAVGHAIDNVGFTGVAFETVDGNLLWRATVQNYSDQKVTRSWKMAADGGTDSAVKSIELEPRGLTTLQSNFPTSVSRITLSLSADDFPLDNTMYLVRPQPKMLLLDSSPALANLSKKLLLSIEAMQEAPPVKADISMISYDPLDPSPITGNAIIFANDATQGGQYLSGGIIAEKDPLLDGLNWQSLLIRETISLDIRESDQILLKQDKRPLILIRQVAAKDKLPACRQLLFNFDPRLSNIENQPALIVILLRFAEQIREGKIAHASENFETSQPISLAKAGEEKISVRSIGGKGKPGAEKDVDPSLPLQSPDEPGFYQYVQGKEVLLDAATYYADTREADFTACAEDNQLGDARASAIQAHSKGDPYWRYWLLALIAVLLASWYFIRERSQAVPA
jgi:hypothetical protein